MTKSNLGQQFKRKKKQLSFTPFIRLIEFIQLIKGYKDFQLPAFSGKYPEPELTSLRMCECVLELKHLKINVNVKREQNEQCPSNRSE